MSKLNNLKGVHMNADNITNNKRVPVMHGELMLTPVDKMPEGETQKHNLYIAAHSETGHNHVIESKAGLEVLETPTERYLLIKEVSKLFHQKTFDVHETRLLAPGVYKVTEKAEYNPFTKVMQRVWD